MGDYRFDEITIIQKLELFHLELPFSRPLILALAELPARSVLLLKWHLQTGGGEDNRVIVGWTEVAPLPGFSRETLSECQQQLDHFFKSIFCEPNTPRKLSTLMAAIKKTSTKLYPSVGFGLGAVRILIESVRLNRVSPYSCELHDSNQYCRRCWLLTESDAVTKNLATISIPAERIKLKVGIGPLCRDIERINALLQNPNFSGKLRLDANRSWSLPQVEILSEQVDASRIEWLEEPLSDPSEYRRWTSVSDIGYALDESLYQPYVVTNADSLIPQAGLAALILKPTLLGLESVYALSNWAMLHGYRSIVSSSFETSVGLGLLSSLAEQLGPQDYHGLDTQKYFQTQSQYSIPTALLRKVAEL